MFITHCLTVTLYLHNFDLFRTCRTSRLRGNWQDVNWHDASRGHSAIAEFLVKLKFSVLHRRENVCCAIFIHAQPLHLSAGSKDGFLRFWKCGPEYRSLTPLFALPMVSNVLCWFVIIINYILEWVWICSICSCISHHQWVIVSTDCINFKIYFTFIVTSICLSAYLTHAYLKNHVSSLHQIFRVCYLWPWLGPLRVMWYIMYFWFLWKTLRHHNWISWLKMGSAKRHILKVTRQVIDLTEYCIPRPTHHITIAAYFTYLHLAAVVWTECA